MIYIGDWKLKPPHVRRAVELDVAHPLDMPTILKGILDKGYDVWVNIPCALSETDWKDVMVLTP